MGNEQSVPSLMSVGSDTRTQCGQECLFVGVERLFVTVTDISRNVVRGSPSIDSCIIYVYRAMCMNVCMYHRSETLQYFNKLN